MTTEEYPLTPAEARAALANKPPGTIIESSNGSQWRRPSDGKWKLQHRSNSNKTFQHGDWHGPGDETKAYRIIPIVSSETKPHVNPTEQECWNAKKIHITYPANMNPFRPDGDFYDRGSGWTSNEFIFMTHALNYGKVEVLE